MHLEHETRKLSQTNGESFQCPDCESFEVRTTWKEHSFRYGLEDNACDIVASLPFRSCPNCHLEFLDHVGEQLMHDAVCKHLGLLTPNEILRLRESQGFSRQQFADLTKLGEATIERWERGALIQNATNDQLLYLLSFPDNIRRLQSRVSESVIQPNQKQA